jgi:TonB-dependent starch-binding outer membrane protein SusC
MRSKIYHPLKCLLTVVFLLGGLSVMAQNRTVTGKVTASDNSLLPGANILLKGTAIGTITDASGNFSIEVRSDNDVLVISSIGFRPQQITIGNQTTLTIAMQEDISQLSEVVVTGYGTERQKDVTGAVSTVAPKDLTAVPAANFAQQLQGRVAGVTVGNENTPGGAAVVRIRGYGTFGNNDPLYVIDGVPTQDNNLSAINQNDIESIQVLKDASSASIYGSRAGNGVVIITTKKGKAGEPKVSFNAYGGTQRAGRLLDLANSQELGQIIWESNANAGTITNGNPQNPQYGNGLQPVIPDYIFPSGTFEGDKFTEGPNAGRLKADPALYSADPTSLYLITRANKEGTKWLDEMFAPATIQNYQLGVTGGSQTGRYAMSLNYFDQRGILKFTGFKRYAFRANSEFTIKKRVRVGENLQISLGSNQGNFGNFAAGNNDESNPISFGYRSHPLIPLFDINGFYAGQKGAGLGNARNPYAALERGKDNIARDLKIFGNTYLEADIIPGMVARTSFGLDLGVFRLSRFNFYDIESQETGAQANPRSVNLRTNYRYSWTWTSTLSYSRTLGANHKIDGYVGLEAIRSFGESVDADRSGYLTDSPSLRYLGVGNPTTATNGGGVFTDGFLFSYFGKFNYAFRDRYLVQFIVRQDKSAAFLLASNAATFPAFSLGWRFSEESFMKSLTFINDAKLRYGYGQTGNQNIPLYNGFLTYKFDAFAGGYGIGGQSGAFPIGAALQKFSNAAGKWEATTSNNIGLDMSLLNNRIDVIIDWYDRKTTGLLVADQGYSLQSGIADLPFANKAVVRNRGLDVSVTYKGTAVNNQLRYSVNVIYSQYRNQVLDVDGNPNSFLPGFGLRIPPVSRTQAGQPLSSFYGFQVDGIFQNAEEVAAAAPAFNKYNAPGKFRFRDINGDGKVNDDDQTYLGSPHPDFTGSFNINVGYKNFDLTIFAAGSYGNKLFNYVRYWTDFQTFQGNRSRRMLYESWRPGKTDATLPILDANDATSSRPSNHFLEDGSYLRFRNIQLTYTLPVPLISKIGLGSAQVYVQGTNWFTFTRYTGLDPDINLRNASDPNRNLQIGVDEGAYPVSKNIIFGVNLGF